jgi:hypothetical protein
VAVALHTSTFSKSRPVIERRTLRPSVRLAVAAVVAGLAALAVASGAWVAVGIVSTMFVLGTALLASGDEPLSVRQVVSVGTIHLLAGALLAL